MTDFVKFKGEFHWTRVYEPELSPFTEKGKPPKYQWNVQFRPADQQELMKIMDLQSRGVKNKLKKTEDGVGYAISFHRPTTIATKRGAQNLEPPKVTLNGVPFTEQVGNGSKGEITVEVYEHGTPGGGKSCAARLYAIDVTDLVKYEKPAPEQPAGWAG